MMPRNTRKELLTQGTPSAELTPEVRNSPGPWKSNLLSVTRATVTGTETTNPRGRSSANGVNNANNENNGTATPYASPKLSTSLPRVQEGSSVTSTWCSDECNGGITDHYGGPTPPSQARIPVDAPDTKTPASTRLTAATTATTTSKTRPHVPIRHSADFGETGTTSRVAERRSLFRSKCSSEKKQHQAAKVYPQNREPVHQSPQRGPVKLPPLSLADKYNSMPSLELSPRARCISNGKYCSLADQLHDAVTRSGRIPTPILRPEPENPIVRILNNIRSRDPKVQDDLVQCHDLVHIITTAIQTGGDDPATCSACLSTLLCIIENTEICQFKYSNGHDLTGALVRAIFGTLFQHRANIDVLVKGFEVLCRLPLNETDKATLLHLIEIHKSLIETLSTQLQFFVCSYNHLTSLLQNYQLNPISIP
ncbi:hypothetical protein Pelo_8164 [Pelomyxa schiedti]|nr:hypothetical protein Pelo_8164 [Pelomyxa schiedti]